MARVLTSADRLRPHAHGWSVRQNLPTWLCLGASVLVVVVCGLWPDGIARGLRHVLAQATLAHLLVATAAVGVLAVVGRRTPAIRSVSARLVGTAEPTLADVSWPASLLLTCAATGAAWYSLGRARVLPHTFADELLHERVARGVAESGSLATHGYGLVSGVVDAFGFWLTTDAASAFHLIQLLNVIVMVSAALPAYLLARRVVSQPGALVVAALTVSVTWMAYSAMIMTEPAFYPVFLLFVLALVRALERPSWGRQAVMLTALVLAFETRTQAICLVGALLLAAVIHGWSRGRTVALLRAFAPTWSLFGAAILLGGIAAAAGVIGSPLGAYQKLLDDSLSVLHPHGLLLWTAANLTSIALGVGVLAMLAFPLGLAPLLRRGSTTSEAAFASASIAVTLAILTTVVVLCESKYGTGTVGERNLFCVVPLVFTGALAWAERGFPRPLRLTAIVLGCAVLLALLMPPGSIGTAVDSRTFGLWTEIGHGATSHTYQMVAAIAVGALVLTRLRHSWPIVFAALATAIGVTAARDVPPTQPRSVATKYEWVDRALPSGAQATVLYVAAPGRLTCPVSPRVGEVAAMSVYTEMFNLKIGPVLQALSGNPVAGVASPSVTIGSDGVVRSRGGPLRPGYVVLDSRIPLVGRRLAELRADQVISPPLQSAGLTLWRIPGTLRLRRPVQIVTTEGLRRLGCD
jgi:hypothetical protein